ncbi:tetratricopeptide repeat protein [Chitiniphilus purpureus]|uniref:Tetratricopeptide repeat protein n=1 Tax=Chitiniphilus purpureus TaxID=2981137 RepID=A0ABY6DJU6_9NEIS|nr:tetratricopeptide repeat protein [Chitiniphilus sp. CD1]UXY14607.1 tetratricopeptide repeat protein [Chitiniphilus sp. CD1]
MSWRNDPAVARAGAAEAGGDWMTAYRHYDEALARWPRQLPLQLACGIAATRAGESAAARALLEPALRESPGQAHGWAALGQACARLGDPVAARAALARAVALDPRSPALRLNLANVLRTLGETAAARAELERALQLAPDYAPAHYNLANLLRDNNAPEAAKAHYLAALDAAPDHLESRYNLGCLLRQHGEMTEALATFEAVLARAPGHADAWHNLGGCRRALGDWEGARAAYRQALALSDTPLPRYALGTLDLLHGRWREGWIGYEARWAACGVTPPTVPLPRWHGEAVAATARLLVFSEQGYGDLLQFARFVPQLQARFATVTLACPPAMARLMAASLDGVTVCDHLPDPATFTHCVPIMSLAATLQVDEAMLRTFPVPYLRTPEGGAPAVRGTGLNIGLCWTGNPGQADNIQRTVPLGLLRNLAHLPGITWHNLQQGKAEQARAAGFTLHDASAHWRDFADTAAYLDGLDLVISACTSIAHLAGALGRPVWLVSRFDADWRWLLAREDSPWYPSLRLFRQPRPGDWPAAVAALEGALRQRLGAPI